MGLAALTATYCAVYLKAGYLDQGAILFIRAHGASMADALGIDHLARMAGGPAFSQISIRTGEGWVHYGT